MMFESWITLHPWMTFILGIFGLFTINSMFVSLGGGYKKTAPTLSEAELAKLLSRLLPNEHEGTNKLND